MFTSPRGIARVFRRGSGPPRQFCRVCALRTRVLAPLQAPFAVWVPASGLRGRSLALLLCAVLWPPAPSLAQTTSALAFDATFREVGATPGVMKYPFAFWATNISTSPLVITQVLSSCGCAIASHPTLPWRLAPGESGRIDALVDITNRQMVSIQTLTVHATAGSQVLTLRVNIPPPPQLAPAAEIRLRNRARAAADRKAVFRNDCARCHLDPAFGRTGRALYASVCALCHEAGTRAPMVPDLRAVNPANDLERWRGFIKFSKSRSLMPAFAQSEGGPLTDAQVDSLAAFLSRDLRQEPAGAFTPKFSCGLPPLEATGPAAPPR